MSAFEKRPGGMRITGWTRDYFISDRMAGVYTDAILGILHGVYTEDDGKTTFQGQSMSCVSDHLRHSARLKFPSNNSFRHNLMEALGFRVVRARGRRLYAGGVVRFGVNCDCVTV